MMLVIKTVLDMLNTQLLCLRFEALCFQAIHDVTGLYFWHVGDKFSALQQYVYF